MGNGQNGQHLMRINVHLRIAPGSDLEQELVQIPNQNMVEKTAMLTKKPEKVLKAQ